MGRVGAAVGDHPQWKPQGRLPRALHRPFWTNVVGPRRGIWDPIFGGGGSGVAQWKPAVIEALKLAGLGPQYAGQVLFQCRPKAEEIPTV